MERGWDVTAHRFDPHLLHPDTFLHGSMSALRRSHGTSARTPIES
jgi:hypothetical protein